MRTLAPILVPLVVVAMMMVALLVRRPDVTGTAAGKVLAFFMLAVIPAVLAVQGTRHHLEVSKTTSFCVSCHVMVPYGKSLHIDDSDFLPANHYQNRRVPADTACYTCHTNYAMFGDLQAKLNGLKHMWVNYTGQVPEELALYQPYHNRECLHCHGGAREFEEDEMHAEMMAELVSNEQSCLDCHDAMHAVAHHDELDFWEPEAKR